MPEKQRCEAPYNAERPYESLAFSEKMRVNIANWMSAMWEKLGVGPSPHDDDPYDPARYDVRVIRVFVHVIWNTDVECGCADLDRIREQIRVLNESFKGQARTGAPPEWSDKATDVRAEFIWDPADLRVQNTEHTMVPIPEIERLSAPVAGRLNIWVCNLDNNWGTASAPEQRFPWFNGVVVDCYAFGVSPWCDAAHCGGCTLPHEVGHWLGLLHTDEPGGRLADVTNPMPGDFMDTCNNDDAMMFFTLRQAMRMRRWIETGPKIMATWK